MEIEEKAAYDRTRLCVLILGLKVFGNLLNIH